MVAEESMTSGSKSTIPIKVEFTGGLEIIFSSTRSLVIELPTTPSSSPSSSSSTPSHPNNPTIADLIDHLLTIPQLDQSRKDLFVLDGTVRPGILVLINDADWALEGEGECELSGGDEVVFVSTLHGG